jgi:probable F420-dependent oxidoreductase
VTDGRALAARLGRVGIWANLDRYSATMVRQLVGEIERLGFGAIWFPETVAGKEAFSLATLLLDASERIVVGTGIASIWARDAMAMANGARVMAEAFPDRFLLGIGVSHRPSAEGRGHLYAQPYARMRGYLDAMDAAQYVGPAAEAPRVLAALGPKMLRLAAERSAGAHPYFVPLEHTAEARAVLGAGPLLAVEQAAVLERDATRAREVARRHTRRYLSLENYVNNLRRLGWDDDDLGVDGGSDRLVDAIVVHGDLAAVQRRVEEHLARGADHVCVQVVRADPAARPFKDLEALADVLLARSG